jgi:RNA recognition motif-containing protein
VKLHIGNLSASVTESELNDLFIPIATPSTIDVIRDHAGASKGFAFAEFATDDEARAVIAGVHGREISGKAVTLAEARPRRTATPRA